MRELLLTPLDNLLLERMYALGGKVGFK